MHDHVGASCVKPTHTTAAARSYVRVPTQFSAARPDRVTCCVQLILLRRRSSWAARHCIDGSVAAISPSWWCSSLATISCRNEPTIRSRTNQCCSNPKQRNEMARRTRSAPQPALSGKVDSCVSFYIRSAARVSPRNMFGHDVDDCSSAVCPVRASNALDHRRNNLCTSPFIRVPTPPQTNKCGRSDSLPPSTSRSFMKPMRL